ncbi:MAG: hypothetical protein WAZ99_06350 [Rectinemataceae bacterium]
MMKQSIPSPTVRFARLFLFLALFLGVCSGCSGKAVESFPWEDASGRKLEFFVQGESGEPGTEASITADGKVRTFNLSKILTVEPGQDLVLALKVDAQDLVARVDLRAGRGKSAASVRYEFFLEPGSVFLHLVPPPSGKIFSMALLVGPSDPATGSGTSGALPVASIERIAVGPAFRGFGRGDAAGGFAVGVADGEADATGGKGTKKSGLVLSSGYSGESPSGLYTAAIAWPFEGLAEAKSANGNLVPSLVVEYSGRSASDIVVTSPEGAKILVQAANPKGRVVLPADLFGSSVSSLTAKFPGNVIPSALYAAAIPAAAAELADLGRVVMAPAPVDPVDFSLYRWDILPDVLVFDFRDYAVQNAYLKRLAFFVEKEGFRGRLATDAEISALHGWNAHDYRPEDLAAFFAASKKQAFLLNPSEKRFETLLLERGVIVADGDSYKPGKGAVISITRESPDYLRRTFATHESIHALFFADSKYREFSSSVWASMDSGERWFWNLYFGWMNYDTSSSYLMANEVQAYLMQQQPSKAREYFSEILPARLLENHPELQGPIDQYMTEYGDRFELRSRALDSWVRAKYGFGAGRAFFVRGASQ